MCRSMCVVTQWPTGWTVPIIDLLLLSFKLPLASPVL